MFIAPINYTNQKNFEISLYPRQNCKVQQNNQNQMLGPNYGKGNTRSLLMGLQIGGDTMEICGEISQS